MDEKFKIDYLDDIMSKTNYALMENEIDGQQWRFIITAIMKTIQEKYEESKKMSHNVKADTQNIYVI